MFGSDHHGPAPMVLTPNVDPEEASLEAREVNQYLLAKSYFDCREYDRCAAIFIPTNLTMGPVSASTSPSSIKLKSPAPKKSKTASSTPLSKKSTGQGIPRDKLPRISQKAMFLALYAKFMAGEKRKDEESEMILGPADGGATVNRELIRIASILEDWFIERGSNDGGETTSQGWLEYL